MNYMTRADDQADIAAELARKPMTRDELSDALLLNAMRISRAVTKMHKARQIHVASWCRPAVTAHWTQVFAVGDLPDVPKPPTRTKAELDRDRRARMKAEAAEKASVAPNVLTDTALSWIPRRAA